MRYPLKAGLKMPPLAPHNAKYPFHGMKLNDSFEVEKANRQNVQVAAHIFGKRHNMRFAIRTSPEGIIRCWRTE